MAAVPASPKAGRARPQKQPPSLLEQFGVLLIEATCHGGKGPLLQEPQDSHPLLPPAATRSSLQRMACGLLGATRLGKISILLTRGTKSVRNPNYVAKQVFTTLGGAGSMKSGGASLEVL